MVYLLGLFINSLRLSPYSRHPSSSSTIKTFPCNRGAGHFDHVENHVNHVSPADDSFPDEVQGWSSSFFPTFLQHYWQQRPLLIRQACPNIDSRLHLTEEDVFALVEDDDVESRLVQHRLPRRRHSSRSRQSSGSGNSGSGSQRGSSVSSRLEWSRDYGPFTHDDLLHLPSANWTLLVQELDRHLPIIASLWEDILPFIPHWRKDDIMATYSSLGGTIGGHVDNYDVFLLQCRGRRRWAIEKDILSPLEETRRELPNSAIRLLKDFHNDREWVLEEGDMLYLPPRLPHCGETLSDERALSLSFGLRAPSLASLMASMTAEMTSPNSPYHTVFYQDGSDLKGEEVLASPSVLSSAASHSLTSMLYQTVEQWTGRGDAMEKWLGIYLTSPLRFHQRNPHPFFLTSSLQEEEAVDQEKENDDDDEEEEHDEDDEDEEGSVSGEWWPLRARHRVASMKMFDTTEQLWQTVLNPAERLGLRRAEGLRVAWIGHRAFIDGEAYDLPQCEGLSSASLAALLFDRTQVDMNTLRLSWSILNKNEQEKINQLVQGWLRKGVAIN
eukprot:scaffold96_cov167-Ochromonas_danica.AAC.27